ncbi:MAG: hypothetical protein NXY57DRAFT_969402 [Lentinula lateritia]|nr:MAG: hypothetical protein NXY57DRAFT_969402 [Lentinula lateritia]
MDSDSISQDDKTAFAAEDSESLDAFDPPASRFATSISHISRTVIHIFQSPNMLYVGSALTVWSVFRSTYST